MTHLLKQIFASVWRFMERSARARAADRLAHFDPQLLKEAGLSQELLRQGANAYPWRQPQAEVVKGVFSSPNQAANAQDSKDLAA